MTWTQLLANNEVQRHKTSKNELDKLRAVIRRDLADASLKGASADRRFATAYNAALQGAKMAIACAGYRVVGAGHHRISFDVVGSWQSGGPVQRLLRPVPAQAERH